ncbi:DUF4064 domain-containing protein [Senegalimassilia faecalis]|uniref:DUF4064 domain-containing protein n=1 Tax=Senegalimassilia faecalis TaxID=2509433 RepID=A0A4Q2K4N4_9ACTN|nr:DmsC/YnfH family molybdoenzyme membrane anchor subunit [Senegalimassilia faecalis]RXZ54773.1 DUF4064 domain-containing protein [Senegalimassilia faecalis]
MELQWPLILFTTFISASAGLFAAQGCYALAGEGRKAQLPALITSVVIMAIGGIAVFFHLTHPDRLFNGFGHITSGITQELIAIVSTFVVMAIFFVYLRRSEENPPKWLAWIAVLVSLVLVVVMGHSYMMPARPTWDSVLQPLSLIGSGFAMGIGIFAALDAMRSQSAATCSGILALASSGLGALTTICYAIAMSTRENTFVSMGYRYDPTRPTHALVDAANYSAFSGGSLSLTIAAIVLALAAFACAFWGKKSTKWSIAGRLIVVCSCASAILLHMVFYTTGGSVFAF